MSSSRNKTTVRWRHDVFVAAAFYRQLNRKYPPHTLPAGMIEIIEIEINNYFHIIKFKQSLHFLPLAKLQEF